MLDYEGERSGTGAGRIGDATANASGCMAAPSPEDRSTLLRVVLTQPPGDRLLAELVFGHGIGLTVALTVKAEEIAWGEDRVKLCAHTGRSTRRTVTVDREVVEGVLGDRRHGPLFATHSASRFAPTTPRGCSRASPRRPGCRAACR